MKNNLIAKIDKMAFYGRDGFELLLKFMEHTVMIRSGWRWIQIRNEQNRNAERYRMVFGKTRLDGIRVVGKWSID